jgi:hypothetical protein
VLVEPVLEGVVLVPVAPATPATPAAPAAPADPVTYADNKLKIFVGSLSCIGILNVTPDM